MQFQTNSAAIKHRQQFIKFNDKVVEPYFNERYKYKTISNTSKINGLNDMQKTTEEETLKIFDDRTLEYNSKHKDLLQITQLDLRNSQITDNGIYFLAISKNAQNIKKIDLSQNTYNIQDAALRFISDSPFLQNLEILLLGDTTITDYGIRYLFQPFSQSIELDTKFAITNFQKTKTKKVVNTQLGSMQYGSQLTQASDSQTQYSEMKQSLLRMQNLKILDLSGNISITDKSVDCITYSTNIKLKYLDLSFTKITDLGLMDYMISPNSEELEYLNVSNQQITDVSIKTLCDSLHCTQLVVLKLNSCPITKLSIEYLADSMNTMNLEELDIGTREQKTELTDEALMKLIKPKFLGKLRILNLQGQAFSEFRINQLFSSTICRSLQELNISHNPEITDNSCKSIASLNLDLKKLNLLKTSVTSKGIEILQTMSAIQVSHSIANMPAIVQINKQTLLGIKLFICDRCVVSQDSDIGINPQMCVICRKRQITTVEYPAKLCLGCGDKQQNKNCYLCGRYNAGKHALYRCYACAIGNKKFQCMLCEIKIQS